MYVSLIFCEQYSENYEKYIFQLLWRKNRKIDIHFIMINPQIQSPLVLDKKIHNKYGDNWK